MIAREICYPARMAPAMLADSLGYESFSLPEGWGFDSTLVLTEIALRTQRITLVSGILSVWGRTPGTLAMSAATLHQISGGRYVLGLGPSTRALVEGFHDVPFRHPADRLQLARFQMRWRDRSLHAPGAVDRCRGALPLRCAAVVNSSND